jgi:prepilin-type N-terminal cleavage/methylation domain-containing protein
VRVSLRKHSAGFTLIEVMISLVVLALAIVGSLSAVIAAGKELRDGQTRQIRGLLGDASAKRWMLASTLPTSTLVTRAALNPIGTACGTACSVHAIGAAPWVVDPTVVIPGDLSTGAYFKVFGNGEVTQITATTTPAVPLNTPCGDPLIPKNVYCREVAFTVGGPPIVSATGSFPTWPPALPGSWTTPVGSNLYTVWIRLSKKGDTINDAIYFIDSFVQ